MPKCDKFWQEVQLREKGDQGGVEWGRRWYLTMIYYYILYRFIVKRLRPLFVGGVVQIHFDWLIDPVA